MTLTKQQKMDMIYDVELRLAKEELAERYVKNLNEIENSNKPLRTLQEIVEKDAPLVTEIVRAEHAGQALSDVQRDEWHDLNERHFEELNSLGYNANLEEFSLRKQEELNQLLARHGKDRDTVEKSDNPLETERTILERYKNTPEYNTGEKQETLAKRDATEMDFDIQKHFENAQSMSNDNDMEL